QTYSLLLFNSALTDFIASVSDALTIIRMVVEGPSIVYIYQGPCGRISESFCFFMYSLMLHLTMHSIALIAISFWYRSIALTPNTLSVLHLQLIVFIILTPSVLLHVSCKGGYSPFRSKVAIFLHLSIGLSALSFVIVGSVSTMGVHTTASTLYVCILPIIAYTVIIVMRRRVKHKLTDLTNMSERTKLMHKTLVRALTVHAFLPMSLCAGVGSFVLLSAGIPRSELLESFPTMGVSFPSVANPLLTFYFVSPLRR
ncbi:hypothetical protein PENTCL1PPCAC_4131, partial [Pristionchus entomophagus]